MRMVFTPNTRWQSWDNLFSIIQVHFYRDIRLLTVYYFQQLSSAMELLEISSYTTDIISVIVITIIIIMIIIIIIIIVSICLPLKFDDSVVTSEHNQQSRYVA